MASISVTASVAQPRAFESILLGGFMAGTLDGLDAIVFFGWLVGATPVGIFQHIASGLIGRSSFQGGWHTVVLGIVLHFTVATGAATVYYFASLRLPALFQRPLLFGPIFGLVVYVCMYYVIVPLSAVTKSTGAFSSLELLNALIAHMFFVGAPIALATAWSARTSGSRKRPAAEAAGCGVKHHVR